MKFQLITPLIFLILGCVQSQSNVEVIENEASSKILPITFEITGEFEGIEDVGLLIPPVIFRVDEDDVEIQVGVTEIYQIDYEFTRLDKVLKYFEVEDFKRDGNYYNPYFKYVSNLKTIKQIEGKEYRGEFSTYKRRDVEIEYIELDSAETVKFAVLSNHLGYISKAILGDDIETSSMITASSLKEALGNPEKVYKLSLRNSSQKTLSSEIGKLSNLRVLDISGSMIKTLPEEIGLCENLKSIVANSSQLEELPQSIVKLNKLRACLGI
jgi:hypothetical protein